MECLCVAMHKFVIFYVTLYSLDHHIYICLL